MASEVGQGGYTTLSAQQEHNHFERLFGCDNDHADPCSSCLADLGSLRWHSSEQRRKIADLQQCVKHLSSVVCSECETRDAPGCGKTCIVDKALSLLDKKGS